VGELISSSSMSVFSSHSTRSGRSGRDNQTRSRSSTFSDFTSSSISTISGDSSISVKVAYNKEIVLLRIRRNISFEDLRVKIYEKFVQQEGVPLSVSFALGFLPSTHVDYNQPRSRSGSMSSSVGFPDLAHMRFISSQHDWERTVASAAGKLTLHAIGEQAI
jgi:hypothetical protein